MTAPQKQWNKEHSPEPWRFEPAEFCKAFNPNDPSFWVCCVTDSRRWLVTRVCDATKEEAEANADRIVACVNFCRDVSSEDIQFFADAAGRTSDLPPLEYMCEEVKRLKAEVASLTRQAEANKEARPWHHIANELPEHNKECCVIAIEHGLPRPNVARRVISQSMHGWYDRNDEPCAVIIWTYGPQVDLPLSKPSPVEAQEKK